MDIKNEMELKKSEFVYHQRCIRDEMEIDHKELIYDYENCSGCGICVEICPTAALELGPITEIATGLDVPPVILDEEKCPFCGMCAAFCPYSNFKMFLSGRNFIELEEYPHLESGIFVNENCLPCLLCEKVCPNNAIELKLEMPKKEEIVPFEKNEGEIHIDMGKCNFCGICSFFCKAFLLIEKDPSPPDPLPFSDLLVDEKECDYCGLCEGICPEEAIKVERFNAKKVKVEERLEIKGRIRIKEEECKKCGWCSFICPYDAVEVKKPFEGEIKLKNLEKCDPSGCRACRNICPSHAWYVVENKIAVEEAVCIHCGACERACPEDVIEVTRTKMNHSPLMETPWREEWKKAIFCIISKEEEGNGNRF